MTTADLAWTFVRALAVAAVLLVVVFVGVCMVAKFLQGARGRR